MRNLPKAYNELVGLLLTEEDRAKFEWAIGAMLSEGPPNIVVIHGGPATGKSTLLNIVRKVLLSDVRAVAARTHIQHDGYSETNSDAFVFSASNELVAPRGAINISTTGDRVSVNKHYVLMRQIDVEALDVAEHCIDVYHNTPNTISFINPQENDR
jgi:hypothetical protein